MAHYALLNEDNIVEQVIVGYNEDETINGISDWAVGDWAIYSGTAWQKIDNTDAVTSVNGYTGTVVLAYSDVGAPSTSGSATSARTASRAWSVALFGWNK